MIFRILTWNVQLQLDQLISVVFSFSDDEDVNETDNSNSHNSDQLYNKDEIKNAVSVEETKKNRDNPDDDNVVVALDAVRSANILIDPRRKITKVMVHREALDYNIPLAVYNRSLSVYNHSLSVYNSSLSVYNSSVLVHPLYEWLNNGKELKSFKHNNNERPIDDSLGLMTSARNKQNRNTQDDSLGLLTSARKNQNRNTPDDSLGLLTSAKSLPVLKE